MIEKKKDALKYIDEMDNLVAQRDQARRTACEFKNFLDINSKMADEWSIISKRRFSEF